MVFVHRNNPTLLGNILGIFKIHDISITAAAVWQMSSSLKKCVAISNRQEGCDTFLIWRWSCTPSKLCCVLPHRSIFLADSNSKKLKIEVYRTHGCVVSTMAEEGCTTKCKKQFVNVMCVGAQGSWMDGKEASRVLERQHHGWQQSYVTFMEMASNQTLVGGG